MTEKPNLVSLSNRHNVMYFFPTKDLAIIVMSATRRCLHEETDRVNGISIDKQKK